MVPPVCCGSNSTPSNPVLPTPPRVPTNVQNILKAVGAAFAFLGSGICVFTAVAGVANPFVATIMALGLATLGIVLLASMQLKNGASSGSASPVHEAHEPPKVFLAPLHHPNNRPQRVYSEPVVVLPMQQRHSVQTPVVVHVPSATSPGMNARFAASATHAQPPLTPFVASQVHATMAGRGHGTRLDRPAPPQSRGDHAQVGRRDL